MIDPADTTVLFEKLAGLENAAVPSRLRLCISAGAPLRPAIGRHFTERFGLKIHTFYGASECGGIGYDASDEPAYEDGFVGQPMRNVILTMAALYFVYLLICIVGLRNWQRALVLQPAARVEVPA